MQYRRISIVYSGIFICFLFLIVRLFVLQILQHDKYTVLSDKNRIYTSFSVAPRGIISDRNGHIIATSVIQYQASLDLNRFKFQAQSWEQICKTLNISSDFQQLKKDQQLKQGPVKTLILKDGLSWDEILQTEWLSSKIAGIQVSKKIIRFYPEKEAFCHILGYVATPQESDLNKNAFLNLPGATLGKSGIEQYFDFDLRGHVGIGQQEVNALRQIVRSIDQQKPIPGKTLHLTLDTRIQKDTLSIMSSVRSGAVIVMDVHSGDILSMVSVPSFDPNLFVRGLTLKSWQQLCTDPDLPLNNRALYGHYSPGSTFKMIVALTALKAHAITPDTPFSCFGFYEAPGRRFHCWKWRTGGHGPSLNLPLALAKSCDVFFYKTAEKLSFYQILDTAKEFGFGRKTGMVGVKEKSPQLPVIHKSQKGQIFNLSIGQGSLLVTPLQLVVMTAALATGNLVTPRLLQDSPCVSKTLSYDFKSIREGMALAVTQGTAAKAKTSELSIAGKTGSTQVIAITKQERKKFRLEERPYHQRDHALFVGYAPVDKPRWAIAVIVEHGGSGGAVAAPLARDILLSVQRHSLIKNE